MLARKRDQRHLHNASAGQRVHRQTHAVDRDGAVEHRCFLHFTRHANVDQQRIVGLCHVRYRSHAIHVPLNEVATPSIAHLQRTFQIDRVTFAPFTDQRTSQRRLHRVHGKRTLRHLLDSQARAADRDTLALFQTAVGRPDPQYPSPVPRPFSPVRGNGFDPSYCAYDSGKHSRRSKTNNVSEPSGRRSTTTQRGASARGDAGTPGNAGTAPSPSQTGDCTQYRRSISPSARSLAPSAPPPSHNNDWIPARRSCAKACASVSGRKTRTPLPSSTDTFAIGASGDDMTQVGTSRAVCTSDTPRLSMARRSNTMRTGGFRGVRSPRAVNCGLSMSAVVPPTAIASNPARSQCT